MCNTCSSDIVCICIQVLYCICKHRSVILVHSIKVHFNSYILLCQFCISSKTACCKNYRFRMNLVDSSVCAFSLDSCDLSIFRKDLFCFHFCQILIFFIFLACFVQRMYILLCDRILKVIFSIQDVWIYHKTG